jgi:hypothetical protein
MAAGTVAFITLSMLSPSAPPTAARLKSDGSARKASTAPMPSMQLTAFTSVTRPTTHRGLPAFPLDVSKSLPPVAVPAASSIAPTASNPVPVTTPPVLPAPPAPSGPVDTVSPLQRAEWERVAMCEEGGNWSAGGGRFSGGLGITRSNWVAYGGLQFAPEGAMATEDQQIMIAERIQPYPPDQHGCRGW